MSFFNIKKHALHLLLVISSVLITGCGSDDSGSDSTPVTPVELTSILMEFNDSNSFLITQGDEKIYSIRVIGTYSNGSTDDLTAQVTWASSNTEVVSVGLAESMVVLTAKEVGQANVFAKFGDIESENKIVVTVVEPEPVLTSMTLEYDDTESLSITQGDEKALTVRVMGSYSNGSSDDLTAQVTWASSNTEVVSANFAESMVVLTAKEVGQANVFAKLGDIESENKIVVAVVEPEPILTSLSIELEETSSIYLMRKGEKSLSVHVKGIYNNEEEIDLTEQVTWNSSDVSVVTAELSGTALRLTGEELGEANIFASFDGVESDNTINITVIYEVYAWVWWRLGSRVSI